jgi:hypothetical protein
MKLKLWLLLAFSLTFFDVSAKLLPLSKWVDSFKETGVNIFYSSDYISQDLLKTNLDLANEEVSSLSTALNDLGLNLLKVGDSIYVIKPLEIELKPTTGLIVQVRDANKLNKLKEIKAQIPGMKMQKFTDGYITFYDINAQTQSVIISSVGYFPKEVDLNLQQGNYQSITVDLSKKPVSLDKIVVTASRYNLANPNASQTTILREDIEHSVSLNNDPFRSVADLAGNSSTGLSGRYRTRGGHENESLILFDNYILRNPYHFNHFFSLYSTINQSVVDGLDFYSGVFPVQYGGRLSSVLSAQSGDNLDKPRHEIGADFVSAYYTYRNHNEDYSRQSLASVRTSLNLIEEKIVDEGYLDPKVHDLYLKFSQDLNANWQSSQHLLLANDDIVFEVRDAKKPNDIEQADSKHRDLNMWAQWYYQNDQISRNFQLYYNNSSKSRAGRLLNLHSDSALYETTEGSFYGFKFNQTYNMLDELSLSFGMDAFYEETTIASMRNIRHFGDLIEQLELEKDLRRDFDFENQGFGINAFFNSRYQLTEKLIFDLGFHFEHKDWIEHDVKSPRFNISYFYNEDTVLRFALGRHQQSQYIDEVYLEDEKIEYHDLTSADMAVIEFNKTFASGINLRIEAYKKEYSQTQPYFENIFNELHILPDLFFDRVEIQPQDSYATGVEFTLKGRYGDIQWLANYTFSDVEDETDDEYHSRSWDQHHALKFSVHMPIKSWYLNISSNYHSGWPRTNIVLTESGYQLGPRNEDTFKPHLEIDAKISKKFKIYNGQAQFSLQVNNLNNSFNTCCIDYSLENGELKQEKYQWLPLTPNASFIYQWD